MINENIRVYVDQKPKCPESFCDTCQCWVEKVIIFSDGVDNTISICSDCLTKANDMLKEANEEQD